MIRLDPDIGSALAPALAMPPATAVIVQREVITPYVSAFFAARRIDHYEEMPLEDAFHPGEFAGPNAVHVTQLYVALFSGIARGPNKRLQHTMRYLLLLDAESCRSVCDVTGTRYSDITLAGRVIGYALAFPLPEVLAFLRKEARQVLSSRDTARTLRAPFPARAVG